MKVILPKIFVSLSMIALFNACSLKPKSQTQTLTIQLPTEIRAAQARARVVSGPNFLMPETLADFDCIGVNVVAQDIPVRTLPGSCAPTIAKESLSMAVAVVSRATGSISLSVPAGYSRLIQLFGYRTSDHACGTVEELMVKSTGVREVSLPYELSRTTTNLTKDTEIQLALTWTASANAPAAFCTTGAPESCGSVATFGCSKWNEATWAP